MGANWLDSAISFVSPSAGARRARARYMEQVYRKAGARKFEGASRGRRTNGWATSSTSANAENGPALVRLRDRSRDLVRNNPYAARAIQAIQTNTVGTGILAKPMGRSASAVADLTLAWKRWAETTECDADGLMTFYGLQSLALRCMAEAGEVLIRRRRRFAADGLTVPLQLQVLEPDFIDTLKNETLSNGNVIVQGVEFNKLGKRVAYWLFSEHPGDLSLVGRVRDYKSNRVPAEDLIHLFRVDRAGQVRGVAWGAPVIIRLRDFDEYEDAQLTRQKIAACFSAFVYDIEAPVDLQQSKDTVGDTIEPGAIEHLPPGKNITFPNPPQVTGYGEFAKISLQAVAAGYGVTYEILTQDLSNVNFSSGRMGWIEFHRNIEDWRWNILIPRMCHPIFRWFCEAAALTGIKKTEEAFAEWTPPAREMIDPTKEVSATIDAIRGGLKTLSGAIREQGEDPEQHLAEWAADAEKIDQNGLVFDSDPRNTIKGGSKQADVVQLAAGNKGGSSNEGT